MRIEKTVQDILEILIRHELGPGQYARYLQQDEKQSRVMGLNPYGCADAANILYTLGYLPEDPELRFACVETLQQFQDPETGLFYEGTHHTYHTTAHCIAALELFDAQPLYPLKDQERYLDPKALASFLESLPWDESPWNSAHRGAGLYASLVITRTADAKWRRAYFDWLEVHNDPVTGLGIERDEDKAPLFHQLNGWFHYLFNFGHAHEPIPHPEQVIDSCIRLYDEHALAEHFGQEIDLSEIDWIYTMNRTSRQTDYRFHEVKDRIADMASIYIPWIQAQDPKTCDRMNDLHLLFGAVTALAELQDALPGEIETEIPLRNVLDRRPFI